MYIKYFFKHETPSKSEKDYKVLLKEITSLDVRKISKLNLLAIYGAIKTLKDKEYKKDLTLYAASNFACIQETYKILQELKSQNPVMPFDFLNINTNNMGFYIQKALGSSGDSYGIASGFLSFERALFMAFLEYKNGIKKEFLVGEIDSALQNLPNLERFKNIDNNINNDISNWFYLSSNPSKTKISQVHFFKTLDELNLFLTPLEYGVVALNFFAQKYIDSLVLHDSKVKQYCSFQTAAKMIDMMEDGHRKSIFISLDEVKRGYIFILES